MILRFILVITLLIGILNAQGGMAKKIPSNEEIAQKLLIETALQQVYRHAPESSILVLETRQETSALAGWMQQNLVDSCIAHDYIVYMKPNDSMDSSLIVEIAQPDITFEYKSFGNKWLFFSRGLKRIVKSNFHISIREKNGMVLLSKHFNRNFEDTLTSIKKVENEKLEFTKGKKINSSIGKRLIEPVLITASAITVVYLFYTLRSSK